MNDKKFSVLVVDDEEVLRQNITRFLEKRGFAVDAAPDGIAALELARARAFDVALVDIRMNGMNGLELLERLRSEKPQLRVVLMTAFGTVESAIGAVRGGARDYLLKPFDLDEVATKVGLLAAETGPAAGQAEVVERFPALIAESEPMRRALRYALEVARTSATVLVTGESGVGKEVLSRAIHDRGARASEPFVAVNCGALPDQLVESELFGHERGAFSGALSAKRGLFEVAERGTIFLDEVAELPPPAQVKLLRAIEQKEIRRVGATESHTVDARIIAATNRDLAELVRERRFREDLYYRLAVFEIVVPPLRERRADVRPLAERFLARHAVELGKKLVGFSGDALARLEGWTWPGNVRELDNTVARAALAARGETIELADLSFPALGGRDLEEEVDDLRRARAAFERRHIRAVLERHGGDKARAAAALGIDISSLYRKLDSTTSSE